MSAEKNATSKGAKRGLKITLWFVGTTVAVLLLLLFFIVPVYLSSDSGTNMLVGKINNFIDGKVAMDDFKMGWFSGIKLTELSFADTAGTTSVKVKEISTKPKYVSLLRGQVALGKTVIDQPRIVLTVSEEQVVTNGKSEPVAKTPTSPTKQKESKPLPLGEIDLEVIKGDVTINLLSREKIQSVQFRDIASRFDINAAGSKSTFNLALAIVGQSGESNIEAKGEVTPPKKGWTLKGTSGDFTVKIDDLELATLKPLLMMAGQDIDVAGKVNADIVAKINDGKVEHIKADAILAGFKSLTKGKEMTLTEPVTLNAAVTTKNDAVKIDRFNVKAPFCNLNCTGDMDSIDYTADANLKKLMTFVGQFADLGGYELAGDLDAKGNVVLGDTIKTSLDYTLKNFVLGNAKNKKFTQPTDILLYGEVSIDKNTNAISVISLKLASAPANIILSGTLGSTGAKSTFTANVNANLVKITPFLEVADAMPEGLNVAGIAKIQLKVVMQKDDIHLTTDNTTIKNLYVNKIGQAETFEEPLVKLQLDVLANTKDKTITVNDLKMDSSSVKIIKGTMKQSSNAGRKSIKGQFKAQYDLAKVAQLASAYMPENLTMTGQRTATLNFESNFPITQQDGFIKNMNADLAFGFDKAEYMGLHIGKADLDIKMRKGVMTFAPFSATANNGNLSFGGSADFTKAKPVFTIAKPMQIIDKVQINDEMTRKMLVYVSPMFAGAVNVRGVADFHCNKLDIPLQGGDQKDVLVDGTIGISDLRMEASKGFLGKINTILALAGMKRDSIGTNMELVPSQFTLKDSVVNYENMQFNIDKYPLNFRGKMGIDSSDSTGMSNFIDMNIALPVTTRLEKVKVGQENTPGRIILPIGGKVNSPTVDTEAAQKQFIQGAIEDGIGDLLKDVLGGKSDSGSGDSTEEIGKKILEGLFK